MNNLIKVFNNLNNELNEITKTTMKCNTIIKNFNMAFLDSYVCRSGDEESKGDLEIFEPKFKRGYRAELGLYEDYMKY